MNFARYVPLSVLLSVGLLAVMSIQVPTDSEPARFGLEDFSRIENRYRELRAASAVGSPSDVAQRETVELLRVLSRSCSQAAVEPALVDRLQRFSEEILRSEKDSKDVTREARHLQRLLSRLRAPASF